MIDPNRTEGYGPRYAPLARIAEELAQMIIDMVHTNTPDMTGRGLKAIIADNIAIFACLAIEAELKETPK